MNKVNTIHLLILSLMLMSSAHAERMNSCGASDTDKKTKPVDLRSEMPPLRDQDSVGWCYGFTAADLMSHYLYKTNGKTLLKNNPRADYRSKDYSVSAMGVSTAYNESQKPSYPTTLRGKGLLELLKLKKKVIAEGGSIREAILAAKGKGICFEKDLSSEDFSYVKDSRCAVKNHCEVADVLNIVYDTPRINTSCSDLYNIQKMFSALDINSIHKIIKFSAREDAINNLVNASCKNKFSESIFDLDRGPVVDSLTLANGDSAESLMKSLDKHLDNGTPVGIMYYADFLNHEGDAKKFNHASTIVGKRFNPKTCEVEYILRNSWGMGCGNYTKDNPAYTKCVDDLKPLFAVKKNDKKTAETYFNGMISCRKNNPPLPRNPRVVCEDSSSHAFIRKSDLEKLVYNVTAIEENNKF